MVQTNIFFVTNKVNLKEIYSYVSCKLANKNYKCRNIFCFCERGGEKRQITQGKPCIAFIILLTFKQRWHQLKLQRL